MKTCPGCGCPVEDGQRYCGECGTKLEPRLPKEPVYTDDERLKNDPALRGTAEPALKKRREKVPELTLEPTLRGEQSAPEEPAKKAEEPALVLTPEAPPRKKARRTPELTLEPDVWGMGAAAAAAPAQAAEAAPAAQASAAALPAAADGEWHKASVPEAEWRRPSAPDGEWHEAPRFSSVVEDIPYENPLREEQAAPDNVPNDYTMSQGREEIPEDGAPAGFKTPNETLLLIWSIVLTCMFSVCGIVGLVKTIKARAKTDWRQRSKLLHSAKIWLIIGTVLRVLAFLSELF